MVKKRAGLVLACFASATTAAAILAACNAVLGIDSATFEGDINPGPGDVVAGNDAGPLTCENYCTVVTHNCQQTNSEYLPSLVDGGVDMNLCMTICRMLPNPGAYYPYPGDGSIATGNTLNCRLWHASAAGDPNAEGPSVHCPHAGPLGYYFCTDTIGASPNVTAIDNFCTLDVPYCDGHDVRPFAAAQNEGLLAPADEAVCESTLADADVAADGGFYQYSGTVPKTGDLTAELGNTLNCRLWHFEYAIQTALPQVHCPHTGDPSVELEGGPGPCAPQN
jgi:hypothetical protein